VPQQSSPSTASHTAAYSNHGHDQRGGRSFQSGSNGQQHASQLMYARSSTAAHAQVPVMAKLEEEPATFSLFNSTEQGYITTSPSTSASSYSLYTDVNDQNQLSRGSGTGNTAMITGWGTHSVSGSYRTDSTSTTRFNSAANISKGNSFPGSGSLASVCITGPPGMNTSPGNGSRSTGGSGSRPHSTGYYESSSSSSSMSLRGSSGSSMMGAEGGTSVSHLSPSAHGSNALGNEIKAHTLSSEHYR
jgi:hypothetical protein